MSSPLLHTQRKVTSAVSTCAGKSMALDTIWMAIASVLSVYNISKAVDSHGNVITPEVKMNPGVVRQVPDSSLQRALLTSC